MRSFKLTFVLFIFMLMLPMVTHASDDDNGMTSAPEGAVIVEAGEPAPQETVSNEIHWTIQTFMVTAIVIIIILVLGILAIAHKGITEAHLLPPDIVDLLRQAIPQRNQEQLTELGALLKGVPEFVYPLLLTAGKHAARMTPTDLDNQAVEALARQLGYYIEHHSDGSFTVKPKPDSMQAVAQEASRPTPDDSPTDGESPLYG